MFHCRCFQKLIAFYKNFNYQNYLVMSCSAKMMLSEVMVVLKLNIFFKLIILFEKNFSSRLRYLSHTLKEKNLKIPLKASK